MLTTKEIFSAMISGIAQTPENKMFKFLLQPSIALALEIANHPNEMLSQMLESHLAAIMPMITSAESKQFYLKQVQVGMQRLFEVVLTNHILEDAEEWLEEIISQEEFAAAIISRMGTMLNGIYLITFNELAAVQDELSQSQEIDCAISSSPRLQFATPLSSGKVSFRQDQLLKRNLDVLTDSTAASSSANALVIDRQHLPRSFEDKTAMDEVKKLKSEFKKCSIQSRNAEIPHGIVTDGIQSFARLIACK